MSILLLFLLAFFCVVYPSGSAAHGGGLNSEGCHTNRKTGDYHCHRAPTQQLGAMVEASGLIGALPEARPYRNCTEARQAGAAPVMIGTPGYGPHLDRDGDGIGCEISNRN